MEYEDIYEKIDKQKQEVRLRQKRLEQQERLAKRRLAIQGGQPPSEQPIERRENRGALRDELQAIQQGKTESEIYGDQLREQEQQAQEYEDEGYDVEESDEGYQFSKTVKSTKKKTKTISRSETEQEYKQRVSRSEGEKKLGMPESTFDSLMWQIATGKDKAVSGKWKAVREGDNIKYFEKKMGRVAVKTKKYKKLEREKQKLKKTLKTLPKTAPLYDFFKKNIDTVNEELKHTLKFDFVKKEVWQPTTKAARPMLPFVDFMPTPSLKAQLDEQTRFIWDKGLNETQQKELEKKYNKVSEMPMLFTPTIGFVNQQKVFESEVNETLQKGYQQLGPEEKVAFSKQFQKFPIKESVLVKPAVVVVRNGKEKTISEPVYKTVVKYKKFNELKTDAFDFYAESVSSGSDPDEYNLVFEPKYNIQHGSIFIGNEYNSYSSGGFFKTLDKSQQEELINNYVSSKEFQKYIKTSIGGQQVMDASQSRAAELVEKDFFGLKYLFPRGGANMMVDKKSIKLGKRDVAKSLLLEENFYYNLNDPRTRVKRSTFEAGIRGFAFPVTTPQAVVKYFNDDKTLFLPDVGKKISEVSYAPTQGVLEGAIGSVISSKSNYLETVKKYPVESFFAAGGEFVGMYASGKAIGFSYNKIKTKAVLPAASKFSYGFKTRFPFASKYLGDVGRSIRFKYAKALNYRYGNIQPIRDIGRARDYIRGVRQEYFSFNEWKRVFNKQLPSHMVTKETTKYSSYGVDVRNTTRFGSGMGKGWTPAQAKYTLPNNLSRPFEREMFMLESGGRGLSLSGVPKHAFNISGRTPPIMISFAGKNYMPLYNVGSYPSYKTGYGISNPKFNFGAKATGKLPNIFTKTSDDLTYIAIKQKPDFTPTDTATTLHGKTTSSKYNPYKGSGQKNILQVRSLKTETIPSSWLGVYDVPQQMSVPLRPTTTQSRGFYGYGYIDNVNTGVIQKPDRDRKIKIMPLLGVFSVSGTILGGKSKTGLLSTPDNVFRFENTIVTEPVVENIVDVSLRQQQAQMQLQDTDLKQKLIFVRPVNEPVYDIKTDIDKIEYKINKLPPFGLGDLKTKKPKKAGDGPLFFGENFKLNIKKIKTPMIGGKKIL